MLARVGWQRQVDGHGAKPQRAVGAGRENTLWAWQALFTGSAKAFAPGSWF